MENIKNLDKQSFDEVIKNNNIVIIDFWAPWCNPCKNFSHIFAQASIEEKNSDITFCKVNTDTEVELSIEMQIKSIPTIIIFVNGKNIISRSGVLSPSQLDDLLIESRKYI
ncbi:Thioredoxin 2 [Candidatus Kinetoplastibacterium sorsogonicusi]|uniref:Thioredoxin n=1 Tax=Candidatus Kinetoplastidibacterium kentomonadis TaxID=1576550 RepID=A0A3Q8F3F2_9PROT|nr:thioredoxin [Candidatus Kinetoplastibacterium sorsogonicusi]AWD32373.1 Thioredoxin 2 [Candidatus Kinetoplastibacterium sorsogonicusi]